ncbi:hypothetical protein RRG08_020868 [Elysia crispata]|uniref:Uncharacterized protein n=1 Tax=Elysia crispata TaxID=231223 RepID=A0AAE0XUV8_9GAST|nr:hypothetical protein RRG08_020868 [Elysia crispata]
MDFPFTRLIRVQLVRCVQPPPAEEIDPRKVQIQRSLCTASSLVVERRGPRSDTPTLALSLKDFFRPSSVLALPCLDGIALRAIIRIKRAITVDQPFLMRCDLSILSFTLTLPYAVLHLLDKV